MDNMVILGYLQYALDGMHLEGVSIDDTKRAMIVAYMYNAFDMLTEEEAVQYYRNHSNTNIKEV